jgi:2-dehydro-3-deoxyphosphogluconate aldolase / (4S)-4-hydroxy-2-oxoglutarate aldolase
MSAFSRMEVYTGLYRTGLLPLFYNRDIDTAFSITAACINGGAAAVEFTNRGDFAIDVFSALVKRCAKEFPGAVIGVGSVSDPYTAALFISHGAAFVVGPSFNADTARLCNRKRIAYIPGCMSVTEIQTAEESGCEIIKIFPGETLGPEFIKAVKGPLPNTSLMPTGGVLPEEKSLKEWFDAGAACVGLGSQLIKKEYVDGGAFYRIEEQVKKCLQSISAVKPAAK